MGLAIILLPVAFALIISTNVVEGAGCPPANKVPGYKQTCNSNYDCKNGQICCPNQSHTKSCTNPAPYFGAAHIYKGNSHNNYKGGLYKGARPKREANGHMLIKTDITLKRADDQPEDLNAGVYCDGVKCFPWEVCLPDPYSKEMKCQLPYVANNEI